MEQKQKQNSIPYLLFWANMEQKRFDQIRNKEQHVNSIPYSLFGANKEQIRFSQIRNEE